MKLVDATYLHSFGGKSILEFIFEKLKYKEIKKLYFLLDSRLKSNLINQIPNENITLIDSSHQQRFSFYKTNLSRFESIICLSNIPPPILTKVKTTLFFHNVLLLNPIAHEISFKNRLINLFKIIYIKHYNQKDYNWVVQTPLMKKNLQNYLNINSCKISIYPIFKDKPESYNATKHKNNFVYISSGLSHKNHIRLLNAFIEASNKTDSYLTVHLTLYENELIFKSYPINLNIEFHGTLNEDDVNRLYNSNMFAIYPSLVESFGLPLIEATNHGCKVIASDLPYVHEIIKPSLTFDPYSVESISYSILTAIEADNLAETKVLVENKLDNFIEFIIN